MKGQFVFNVLFYFSFPLRYLLLALFRAHIKVHLDVDHIMLPVALLFLLSNSCSSFSSFFLFVHSFGFFRRHVHAPAVSFNNTEIMSILVIITWKCTNNRLFAVVLLLCVYSTFVTLENPCYIIFRLHLRWIYACIEALPFEDSKLKKKTHTHRMRNECLICVRLHPYRHDCQTPISISKSV